jgi:DNA helicase II / ATP-dependent DNA helicase PcrA
MPTDLTSRLNPEQLRAVTTIDGPLLILAGAGSGKTRVIAHRIAHLLEHGVPQRSILALTFTNKAAREMQDRIKALTGKKLRDLHVSTFHAFGAYLLRINARLLGYRENFSIYDQSDQLALLRRSAEELSTPMDAGELKRLLHQFSRLRAGLETWGPDTEPYRPLFDEYREHLKLHNAVDFDDLIALPIELLESSQKTLAGVEERFSYVLVDEFQDTSKQQYRLLWLLTQNNRNVSVVGDDDQSIYSWRGADYSNIEQFEKDFPERLEIKLEQNYRSSETILEAANGLIANNLNRKGKKLWTGIAGGSRISLSFPEDDREEADQIARRIKNLSQQEGVRYDEVGVLVRTNSLTRVIEEALLANNIPYRVSGGSSFFERKEVRDLVGYLRLVANPADEVSLLRVINTPRRGIGKKSLETLTEYAESSGVGLYSAVEAIAEGHHPTLSARAAADFEGFTRLLADLREALYQPKNMAKAMEWLIDEIDYWGHIVGENQANEQLAKWKYQNAHYLVDTIRNYESDPDNLDPSLFEFLSRITLQGRDDDESTDKTGKVNLMTIHAAKGLEHEVVFVAGVEDGIIPHARAIEEDEKNLEEERRLFYVAVTRAKKHLYLSACRRRTVMRTLMEAMPSPFLEEIPAHLIEEAAPEAVVTPAEAEDYFGAMKAKFRAGG